MAEQSISASGCSQLTAAAPVENPEVPISYRSSVREWVLEVVDGGTSAIVLLFCPWCGERLPPTLRDRWFDVLDSLGLEPGDPRTPVELASDRWWLDLDAE